MFKKLFGYMSSAREDMQAINAKAVVPPANPMFLRIAVPLYVG
jgi:hypothetical protein